MTDPPAAPSREPHVHGSWRSAFFSTVAPELRARSGSDAVRLILGLLTTLLVIVAWRSDPSLERWWAHNAVPPPSGFAWILTTLFLVGTFGTAVLLAGFALAVRRRDLLIDVAAGYGSGLLLSYAIQFFMGARAGRAVIPVFHHVNLGFPVPVLTAAVGMGIAGSPYLSRGVRRFVFVSVTIGIVGALTTGRALPLALLGSVVIGWLGASVVRLALGRPHVGVPLTAIRDALAPLGVVVTELGTDPLDPARAEHRIEEWGVERVYVRTSDNSQRRVSVYGRDARDAELLSSMWRLVSTRESGVAPFVGRQQQAEHEALAVATISNSCPGQSPALVGLTATASDRDVLVVVSVPDGQPLRDRLKSGPLDRAALVSVATLVQRIHSSRVALGTIDLDHLAIDASDRVVLDDTLHAELNATTNAIDQDFASLLVLLALCSDVPTAVDVAMEVYGHDALLASLAYLEKPALNVTLRREIHADKTLLADLRKAGADRLKVAEPKIASLRRVKPTTLLLAIGSLVGGWALLGVFANVAGSINTLKGANWAWVALTFVLSQSAFVFCATADLGAVSGRIPLGRLTMLEVANSFTSLAARSVAAVASRVRFLQRQGYDATQAIASGVLVSIVSWIVKLALVLVALPFAWSHLHFSTRPHQGGSHGHLVADILVFVVVIGVGVTALLAVPRWRRNVENRVRPKAHELRAHLASIASQPRKLAEIFGGSIAQQLAIAFSLGTALHAFGAHLSIAVVLVVLTVGSALGGLSPAPGGAGVVEAGMILALTAAGVSQPVAVAATFVQRLFTSYLPPIWGYVALMWLRRHDEL
jgi:uncharacterized membrane protein YbhN (UPF0104 family)